MVETNNYRNKLDNFFSNLIYRYRITREVKKYTDRYLASEFNLINLLLLCAGKEKEKCLSRIISVLLDPMGGHGQGTIFLKKFLDKLNVSTDSDLEKAEVKTEAHTDTGRRIDILIEFEDGFKIGIENKPWAKEQRNQLKDYKDYLEKKTGGNYRLVFLRGRQEEPSECREEKVICVDYQDFLSSWLRECLKECEADKVRWFIRDFIVWIENEFGGGKSDE